MTYISIDTDKKQAQQFLEYVKTLPFAKIHDEPNAVTIKAKEEAKNGKTKKHRSTIANIEFAPDVIKTGKKIYKLRFPLLSTMESGEGQIKIENKMLGIYAYGASTDVAEQMFSEEFDYLVKRYNELPDSKLTSDVKAIKSFLNHIIKK